MPVKKKLAPKPAPSGSAPRRVTEAPCLPRPRYPSVADVLARVGARPDRTLFVGDGARDFEVCRELGIHFIYLAQYSDWEEATATMSTAPGVSYAPDWQSLLSAFGVA